MKRTDITELFPDATDEQVSALMNINGADINNARGNSEELQTQLATANATIEQMTATAADNAAALAKAKETETELNNLKLANSIREMREKVSKETGVPVALIQGDTEEACTAWANQIKEYAKPSAYPTVKDAGEVSGTKKQTTRQQFAEWFNKQI